MNVKKLIGRLMLAGAVALICIVSIPQFLDLFNKIKELFQGNFMEIFKQFTSNPEAKKLCVEFLTTCFCLLTALITAICALFGKSGFWYFVVLGISVGIMVWHIIAQKNSGVAIKDIFLDKAFWKEFGSTALMLGGWIFLKIS